jgi:hypothetical protein
VLPPYWAGAVVVAERKTNLFFVHESTLSFFTQTDLTAIVTDLQRVPCWDLIHFHGGRFGKDLDSID